MLTTRVLASLLAVTAATTAASTSLRTAALADVAQPVIDATAAGATFREAETLCRADGGKLWGVSLCGPMMFVDPQTHAAVGNRSATGAVRDRSLYRFTLPDETPTANTSVAFDGMRWTMILWPLPANADSRAVLLMHESYHRIQPQLGLTGSGGMSTNGHLDTEAGRVWLRGELHALADALRASGSERQAALRDALAMRAYRRSLYSEAAEQERALELNEGLAESTGIDAGLPAAKRIDYTLQDLTHVEGAHSYVREFPYGTGAAYAELLDGVRAGWRRSVVGATDLGALAGVAYAAGVVAPAMADADAALERHGGTSIRAEEAKRSADTAARDRRYQAELIDGPILTLPLRHMQMAFNPQAVESFAGHGSVYHTLHVSDDWGALDVADGDALIGTTFSSLAVTAPSHEQAGIALSGPGWTLRLAPGYTVAPDSARPGSFIIVTSSS